MMKLNDETYDVLKWVVWVLMPGLIALLSGLGEVYAWEDVGQWVTVLSLLTTFLGGVTGVSNHNYNKAKEKEIEIEGE